MVPSITPDEAYKAVRSPKNRKNPGLDIIPEYQLKKRPRITYEIIVHIINETAYLNELKHGCSIAEAWETGAP